MKRPATVAGLTRRGGFTLIELLISVLLMVILLAAATLIFIQTTDLVATQEARMAVYVNARYALDQMENDLLSCVPFSEVPPPPVIPPGGGPPPPPPLAIQSFWMENGLLQHSAGSAGSKPKYGSSGGHNGNAGDRISFRATVPVGAQLRTAEVTYELIPSDQYLDASGATAAGDSSRGETIRTQRGLYTLVRRIRVSDPATPTRFELFPVDALGDRITDTELCHYVLSFNLEYFDSDHKFSQLDPSPFQNSCGCALHGTTISMGSDKDALGNAAGKNDTPVSAGGTPYRVPFIRVTLVIVEDTGERQERTIQKTVWVPTG